MQHRENHADLFTFCLSNPTKVNRCVLTQFVCYTITLSLSADQEVSPLTFGHSIAMVTLVQLLFIFVSCSGEKHLVYLVCILYTRVLYLGRWA